MRPFGGILQHFACLGIDADFISRLAVLDVEGITQPTAALFLFEFLITDRARPGFERDGAGVFQRYLGGLGQIFSGIGDGDPCAADKAGDERQCARTVALRDLRKIGFIEYLSKRLPQQRRF